MPNHTPNPLAGSQTISRAFNNGDREQITLPPVPRARKVRGQAGPLTPGGVTTNYTPLHYAKSGLVVDRNRVVGRVIQKHYFCNDFISS